ncbi:MAG: hypothetical protein HOM25_12625 [Rhodospirillaceae bacterium]|jgi:hypothetical protein|nr:hypothetical protein [Rhodospirillaceae bacterium]MBT5665246.1 hypothetical protein [Rhodospirillaceae bacterium]MBT5809461.1 hypothetical protein [Rhodospirillaceae bacterium]
MDNSDGCIEQNNVPLWKPDAGSGLVEWLRTLAVAFVVWAVFGAGFLVAPGSGSAQTETPQTFNLEIRDGKVVAANKTLRVTEGQSISLSWTTDKAVELHLHGYDIHAFARPDRAVSMTFKAHTAGRFPVTSHGAGHHSMIYLEVHPQ